METTHTGIKSTYYNKIIANVIVYFYSLFIFTITLGFENIVLDDLKLISIFQSIFIFVGMGKLLIFLAACNMCRNIDIIINKYYFTVSLGTSQQQLSSVD